MGKNKFSKDHKPPVSRRDFLAQGFYSMFGASVIPSVLSLIPQTAEAACPTMGWAPGLMPFFVFDLAGGAAMTGNFLVGKEGGPQDLLARYDFMGWNPRASGAIDTRFGLPMAGNGISKMLVGLSEKASPEALAKLKMASLCHFGQADSINIDKTSAILLVSEAGLAGQRLGVGLSTRASASGGNQGVPIIKPMYKPLQLSRFEDLTGALSFGPYLAYTGTYGRLPAGAIESMARSILKLNQSQSKNLAQLNNGAIMSNLINCGSATNIAMASPASFNMDPRKDPIAAQVFGISEASNSSDDAVILAAIAFNGLKGYTGPGAIANGGYDYHTREQTLGDKMDLIAGQKLGMIIELAHRLQQPFMFQIITDGGMASIKGTRDWVTDTASSLTVMGYYNPKGVSQTSLIQLGNYTDGQGVNGKTLIGNSTEKVAYAVFANYLAACGQLAKFRDYVSASQFPTPEGGLEKILFFT